MTGTEETFTESGKYVKMATSTKKSTVYFKRNNSFFSSGVFQTAVIFFGYACTGLVSSLMGSTFVHLEHLFQCDTSQISFTMTLLWAGCLIGGLLCIATSNVSSDEPKMAFSLMLIAVTTIIATLYPSIYWFFTMIIIQGCGFAIYNSVSQSYVLHLWYNHRLKNPMTQTVHAVWSLFLALGPLIISPFLVDISDMRSSSPYTIASNKTDLAIPNYNSSELDDLVTSFSSGSTLTSISHENENNNVTYSFLPPISLPDVSIVRTAYIVLGLPLFVPAFIIVCIYFNKLASLRMISRSKIYNLKSPLTATNSTNSDKYLKQESSPITKSSRKLFLFLVIVFFVLYVTIEVVPRCFLTTFTAKYLGWSTRNSTLINTIFSGCLFAGRIIGVPLSAVIRSRTLLVMNFVIITTASILMLFAEWNEGILVWPAAGILEYGLSSTYAGFILWVSENVPVTTGMMAMAMISTSIGGMIVPPLVGHLFDRYSPMWIAYVTLIATVLNVMIFIVLLIMINRGTKRKMYQADVVHSQKQTVIVSKTDQFTLADETIGLRK